jgi:hypothetical protein
MKHPTEIGEGVFVRFQERLLRCVQIGAVEGRPAAIERMAKT